MNISKEKKIYLNTYFYSIAIFISISAIPISLIIKEFFGISGEVTNYMFFLGLLLLPDYRNLLSLKFIGLNKYLLLIIVYQIFIILFGMWNNTPLFLGNGAQIYNIYIVVMIFLISTRENNMNEQKFINVIWLLSGIFNIILTYLLTNGFSNFTNTAFAKLSTGGDRLSLSNIAFIYMYAVLIVEDKKCIKKVVKFIFLLSALINIMICARRGLMISYIVILIIHYKNHIKLLTRKVIAKDLIKILCLIICGIIVIRFIGGEAKIFYVYIEKLINAIGGFWGSTNHYDASSIARNNVWSVYPKKFFLDTTLKEFFIGQGYNKYYIDVPILQAFLDTGIIGGIYYLILQLIIPIKLINNKNIENPCYKFILYFSIGFICQNLYSGTIYGYYKFVGLVCLYYMTYKSQYYYIENNDID